MFIFIIILFVKRSTCGAAEGCDAMKGGREGDDMCFVEKFRKLYLIRGKRDLTVSFGMKIELGFATWNIFLFKCKIVFRKNSEKKKELLRLQKKK